MPIFPEGGYRVSNEYFRTNNRLFINDSGDCPTEEFLTDPYLPVLFTYPYAGSYFRPAEVQVAKGTIVAIRANNPADLNTDLTRMKEFYGGKLRTVITTANGGAQATDSNGHIRYANYPIGIIPYNCYRLINDRFDGNYPSVKRSGYIEIPYISNLTLAANMKWACAASNGTDGANMIRGGDHLMSNSRGQFVKWDSVAATQIVAQVLSVDTTIPVRGWLQWVMWDIANEQNRLDMFNPYDLTAPAPTPDTGMTVFNRANLTANDYQNHFMPDRPDDYGFDMLYRWPEHIWDAMGIPGFTDGARMAATDYTENFVGGTINATTNVATIQLAHLRVAKDEEGAANPTAAHPFPTKLLLYKNGSTSPLFENLDYRVDRYRAIVYVLSGTANNANNAVTDTYAITYTSLENQIVGVPTNWDFRGSIGAVRAVLKLGA